MFIEDELSKEARINNRNIMTILKSIGRDKKFILANGILHAKTGTRNPNGDELNQPVRDNRNNSWRTVRGRSNFRGQGGRRF